ncbi:MAG: hypothetical protein KDD37_02930 [Bdellovibrionales bacterium]|nr:hypothetical protein [Bdellovibrionales bacterium]
MVRSIVIGFFAALLFVGISTYVKLGAYKEAQVYYDKMPSYKLIYLDLSGDYSQTSLKLNEVETLLKTVNIPCPHTFGLFLDDPNVVVTQDMKAKVGCIYNDTSKQFEGLPKELQMTIISGSNDKLSASFEGSPALGPKKVYVKAQKIKGQESLFPALEIYSFNSKKELTTKYFFSVDL